MPAESRREEIWLIVEAMEIKKRGRGRGGGRSRRLIRGHVGKGTR
jgi:hypothetical protein